MEASSDINFCSGAYTTRMGIHIRPLPLSHAWMSLLATYSKKWETAFWCPQNVPKQLWRTVMGTAPYCPKSKIEQIWTLEDSARQHRSASLSDCDVTLLRHAETCRDVLCPGSSTCVVDQTNNAYCVTCNRICPEVTSPEQYLCGNDGIVYASACHLRRATCLLGRSIGVAYEGKCISE